MTIQTSLLLNRFQTSVFTELSTYKNQKKNQGIEMIDLSIGSPDQAPPFFIMEKLVEMIQNTAQYGYTLSGIKDFHEAVQAYYQKKFHVPLHTNEEILLLMGSQDGLVHLPMALCNYDDVILVPDPGYTAYQAGVYMAGANIYPMPLKEEEGFLPNLKEIPNAVAEKAKLMILNFPGNPVPALADRAFFEEVVAFAKKHHIVVLHDFAYSDLVFDGKKPISFLEIEGAKDIGVEFHSLSKSYNMAGCRIGYGVGNAEVLAALAKLKSNLDYGVFEPVQHAAAHALLYGEDFLKENAALYQERRDVLVDGLRSIGWKVKKPGATMFVWAAVPTGYRSTEFAYELIDRAGVVVVPGNAFGEHGEGYVRIALVQPVETLKKAVQRIAEANIF
ncbi:LL-diaminopimelate aminotransferase [Bacillus taeanensis]|uniref:Aminotransferase n=1 Tax=Bacillus taeanensis TaxID=273032 RepID=A0A366XUB2_9BACI|nr:LL-diaminopimelate aminotransferase [Bacillus taeanensis]RBW69487.1 LL-diaminopimelate aminotransferase [Bacillus taeanensis]